MAACQGNKCPEIKLIFAFMQIGSQLMNPFKVVKGSVCALGMSEGERTMVYFGKKAVREKTVISILLREVVYLGISVTVNSWNLFSQGLAYF